MYTITEVLRDIIFGANCCIFISGFYFVCMRLNKVGERVANFFYGLAVFLMLGITTSHSIAGVLIWTKYEVSQAYQQIGFFIVAGFVLKVTIFKPQKPRRKIRA